MQKIRYILSKRELKILPWHKISLSLESDVGGTLALETIAMVLSELVLDSFFLELFNITKNKPSSIS